jgi:hypothetical protein
MLEVRSRTSAPQVVAPVVAMLAPPELAQPVQEREAQIVAVQEA